MLQTHFTNLYYKNFSQTALISSSTRPKAKTSFSKEFPNLPLCTNNEFNKITDPAIFNFLKKSMPILNNYPPLSERQIGIRLSKFKPSIINISGSVKYVYAKKLESYRAPEYLNFQAYSLYVVYEDFLENFCAVETPPSRALIQQMRVKKLDRLNNSDLGQLVFLFDEMLNLTDCLPEGIEPDITAFLNKFEFTTRSTGNGHVRCDFKQGDFLKLKALLERFENTSFKKTSGEASLATQTVNYYKWFLFFFAGGFSGHQAWRRHGAGMAQAWHRHGTMHGTRHGTGVAPGIQRNHQRLDRSAPKSKLHKKSRHQFLRSKQLPRLGTSG